MKQNLALVILLGLLCIAIPVSAATTWYVDDDVDAGTDFTNIQDAISNATSGDTIVVSSGTYTSFSLTGDKSYLTLQASESNGPVMIDNGGPSSQTLRIPSGSSDKAVGTLLDGFTFANMTPPFQLGSSWSCTRLDRPEQPDQRNFHTGIPRRSRQSHA